MKTFENEIFIISLKNIYKFSKKRTDILLERLKNLGFINNQIYFVGIDGRNLKDKKINSKYICSKKFDFYTHLGTLGCALSHIIVLKLIQIKNIQNSVLVLEEDALIRKNFSFLMKELPLDYDIIYLHSYNEKLFYNSTENNFSPFFRKINKQIKTPMPPGRQALLINGNKINKIIKHLLPYKKAGDWHNLTKYNNLNLYLTNPSYELFCQPYNFKESYRIVIDHKYKK